MPLVVGEKAVALNTMEAIRLSNPSFGHGDNTERKKESVTGAIVTFNTCAMSIRGKEILAALENCVEGIFTLNPTVVKTLCQIGASNHAGEGQFAWQVVSAHKKVPGLHLLVQLP